jgi:hypothetical protein
VHNEDVLNAILLAVARRGQMPPEVTLLIGEPESLSYAELQGAFGRLIHGVDWKTYALRKSVAKVGAWVQEKLPLNRPPFIKPWMIDLADDNFELDISRARTILGWAPQHSLRDTLPTMVAALKADPFVWYRENDLNLPLWLRELTPPPKDASRDFGPDELMQLEQQVQLALATPGPSADAEPARHAMLPRGKANTAGGGQ